MKTNPAIHFMSVFLITFTLLCTTQSHAYQPQKKGNLHSTEEKIFYRYVDEKGTVLITDDLSEIPPEHREKVEKIVVKKEKTPAGTYRPKYYLIDQHGTFREYRDKFGNGPEWWRERIRKWKKRRENALKRIEELKRQYFQNPLLDVFDRMKIQKEIQKYQKEVEKAEHMLKEVIPEEARKAGALPGWLRDVE